MPLGDAYGKSLRNFGGLGEIQLTNSSMQWKRRPNCAPGLRSVVGAREDDICPKIAESFARVYTNHVYTDVCMDAIEGF